MRFDVEISKSALIRQAQQTLRISTRATDAQLEARAKARSLSWFVQWCWPIIEPRTPLIWSWAISAICLHVEALLTGTLGKQNLATYVPPGFAKSTVVSVCAPVWMWLSCPWWRALLASGNERVSTRDSLKRRAILESPAFRQTFGPTWSLADDENLKTRYANTMTGFHQSMTTQQRVTGDRADGLFTDDPTDVALANSAAESQSLVDWWGAYANRLSNMTTGTRCAIMQRVSSRDFGQIVEAERADWEILTIPQEWDEKRRFVTSIGWTDPRHDDGDLAFPERFPKSVIDQERLRLGRSGFSAQHQQLPFDASGEIFRTDSINRWPVGLALPEFSQRILSLDTAFSVKSSADYSVMLELGQFDRGIFIISCLRQRLEYPQLKTAAIALSSGGGISAVLVEDKASGQSLVQDLKQSTSLPVVPVKVDSDKVSRAHAIVPSVEAGRIFVPDGAAWLDDFLLELAQFPKGHHDDIVDAFTQGVNYLLGNDMNAWISILAGAFGKVPTDAKADTTTTVPEPRSFADRPGIKMSDL